MPDDRSPLLSLPFIQPAQAQKHVTHNEALVLLDALVQLAVISRTVTAPPPAPAEGARYIVPAAATGAWAGAADRIALWDRGSWRLIAPAPGWCAVVTDAPALWLYTGSGWMRPDRQPQEVPQIGIGTTADTTNRLAVAAPATLLSHDGGGHQVKINRATGADTASLLFQSGWSGRAEIGLVGDDDLRIKASADGALFRTALQVAAGTGVVSLPEGLRLPAGLPGTPALAAQADGGTGLSFPATGQLGLSAGGGERARLAATGLTLDVPLTGAAVQAGPHDSTAGRLLTSGAYGWGQGGDSQTDIALAAALTSGVHQFAAGDPDRPGSGGGPVLVIRHGAANLTQIVSDPAAAALFLRRSTDNGASWSPWSRSWLDSNILAPVSQSAGMPTGGLIETAATGTGRYLRLACGTQFCWADLAASAAAATVWTFPAAFAAAPAVHGTAISPVLAAVMCDSAPTATGASISIRDKTDARRADSCRLMAIGRWF